MFVFGNMFAFGIMLVFNSMFVFGNMFVALALAPAQPCCATVICEVCTQVFTEVFKKGFTKVGGAISISCIGKNINRKVYAKQREIIQINQYIYENLIQIIKQIMNMYNAN